MNKLLLILSALIVSLKMFALSPTVERDLLSKDFTAKVAGVSLPVKIFDNVSCVRFFFTNPEEIEITTALPHIKQVEISPMSKNIKATIKGKRIRFKIEQAGYYVVNVNSEEKIFVFAEEPAQPQNKTTVDIRDYEGVDPSGNKKCTEAIQKALDDISGSGKTLVFGAGTYLTGTLKIKSNSDIFLAPDAVIQASGDKLDFPEDAGGSESDPSRPSNLTNNGEWMTFSRLILLDNAHNVRIHGFGAIDGNGLVLRPKGKPANLVRMRNCSNVVVEQVTLRNPAAWNTHVLNCDSITFRNVKILNNRYVANGDGIDPDASRNVLVEKCFMYCSDDNIAIKTTNNSGLLGNVDNIMVRGNVFLTRKSAMKVGTETKGALMANIVFEDNDIVEADRALALYCNDGATFSNISFINNRIESNFKDSRRCAIDFRISERFGKGKIENILIKDCSFVEPFPRHSVIKGLNNEHQITGLVFDNVTIEGIKLTNAKQARIEANKFTDITFK